MPSIKFNKRITLIFLIIILIWLCLLNDSFKFSTIFIYFYNENSIKCYRYSGETLSDITTINVRKGKSIFFHETSCNSYINKKIVITPRQGCAVESAALLNPNLDIYLLFTSPGIFKFEDTESDRMIQTLFSYKNVRMHHLNYENYTRGTPLQELYQNGKIESSDYAMSHASDVLRYLTLWKYGGIYLDLDVVVTKNLEDLPPNFSGCESNEHVAAGIMGFQENDTGHALAEECIMDLKDNFSGTIWGYNGPGVITRLVKKHCKTDKISDTLDKTCDNFKVFSPKSFYAVPWEKWEEFLNEKYTDHVLKITNDSYIIHVWNKYSKSIKLPLNSKSAYSIYAKQYCPRVYSQCDTFF